MTYELVILLNVKATTESYTNWRTLALPDALPFSEAQSKFCSSSKRAFNSTTAVTDLPASAAAISALITAGCLPARYSVCLIATTSGRSEEHTSELQSLMRISYAVFCSKKKNKTQHTNTNQNMSTTQSYLTS